jgi:hypothetical protein
VVGFFMIAGITCADSLSVLLGGSVDYVPSRLLTST